MKGINLIEAEDIKKRWQEYTEELYKKDLHDQDNNDGVITHLELDILECEVKWALESITTNKASGGWTYQSGIKKLPQRQRLSERDANTQWNQSNQDRARTDDTV